MYMEYATGTCNIHTYSICIFFQLTTDTRLLRVYVYAFKLTPFTPFRGAASVVVTVCRRSARLSVRFGWFGCLFVVNRDLLQVETCGDAAAFLCRKFNLPVRKIDAVCQCVCVSCFIFQDTELARELLP